MDLTKKKILITGFAPFGGDEFNPSFEAVKLLPGQIEGAGIIKAELPVLFDAAADQLLSLLEEHQPDIALCTGLAGGRSAVTPEAIAVNLRSARIPDNAGRQPVWEKIVPEGPDGIFSTLPVREMADALAEEGIPSAVSFSAGSFVCNEVMYRLLYAQRTEYPQMQAGFVHVPYAEEFAYPEGAFSLSVRTIAQALERCIRVIRDGSF